MVSSKLFTFLIKLIFYIIIIIIIISFVLNETNLKKMISLRDNAQSISTPIIHIFTFIFSQIDSFSEKDKEKYINFFAEHHLLLKDTIMVFLDYVDTGFFGRISNGYERMTGKKLNDHGNYYSF